ncbi:hypothetical protein BTO06_08210 [Tenacibaculum sp. SZ-18]|uniref:hypothetical protein n=1 Tax=Tenacibaculum sp. SZ-18 TaxID=754423 RepID=UPI000C2D266E|nr:hypothetical protein [Tenacibaculum sp. SZ-18]AUC15121.1 hypothetical protein BTO06_08210 [Tenacibaculum sp. SZ-18]
MEENKIDQIIKEKFNDRVITPSGSSWERLESMMDEQKGKSKKKYYHFISIAASIILLFGIFFGLNTNQIEEIKNKSFEEQIIVTVPENINEEKNTLVVEVDNEKQNDIEVTSKETQVDRENKFIKPNIIDSSVKKKLEIVHVNKKIEPVESNMEVVAITSENKNIESIAENKSIRRVKVNAEDLLFAVTHSPDEVKEYYVNLKMKRSDVLDSIKIKLNKSNLEINPEIILAEVERSIEDDAYQGNFKNNLGRKISDIIVAVANRNK